jgi:outer membrane protein OmpA-like peptidoglycan-associated protein
VALTAQPSTPENAPAAGAQETLSTLTFDKDSARLPDGAKEALAHLASRMTEDATLEVQLLAYAAGDEENASKARRLSLSRALAVRSFLIDQGVRSTRIEVRALGNKVPEGSPDRVDIIGQKRG